MSDNHELHSHMSALARKMRDHYARIQQRVREDPGTAGDQGEENWAELLRAWLPPSYTVVTKGRILGHDGTASPQVDVIVLSPGYPPALYSEKLYLAGGVTAAFECKLTLRPAHLRAAVETSVAIRRLSGPTLGTPYGELVGQPLYGVLAHSSEWSHDAVNARRKVSDRVVESDKAIVTHPRQMLDLICVADVGSWVSSRTVWIGPNVRNTARVWLSIADRFVPLAEVEDWSAMSHIYGPNGSASTAFVTSQLKADEPEPSPLFGPFLTGLLAKLAWNDPTLRPIANYFLSAGLLGHQTGEQRLWPIDIYSPSIRDDVMTGARDSHANWDLWGLSLI